MIGSDEKTLPRWRKKFPQISRIITDRLKMREFEDMRIEREKVRMGISIQSQCAIVINNRK
jgi:hypothetical protein